MATGTVEVGIFRKSPDITQTITVTPVHNTIASRGCWVSMRGTKVVSKLSCGSQAPMVTLT